MFVKVENDEQITEVVSLAQEIWTDHYTSIIGPDQVKYMLDKYQSFTATKDQINNQNYIYFLVKSDAFFVGYTAVQPREGSLFLSKVYVKSSQRGQGIGREIINKVKEISKEKGLKRISLTCNKENYSSLVMYEKCGFVKVKSEVADIGNGYVMDDYIMELTLD